MQGKESNLDPSRGRGRQPAGEVARVGSLTLPRAEILMFPVLASSHSIARWSLLCAVSLAVLAADKVLAQQATQPAAPPVSQPAAPPGRLPPAQPAALSLNDSVAWALQNNPALAALRQQHGIAAAAVVIAQTYPFNPVWTSKPFADNGPAEAGITNRLAMEQRVSIDLEVRGQGKYRRRAACAALRRTDWEIAAQELALVVRVIRAYGAVLYRQEKLQLIEQMIGVNQEAARQVEQLVKSGKLRPTDLLLIQTEVTDSRAQLTSGRTTLVAAVQEFRRALGLVDDTFQLEGSLQTQVWDWDAPALTQTALERRPDLRARQIAVAEAGARLGLAIADRFGNINLGPDYEYNETRVNFIGAQMVVPLPVLNNHRGEILQRRAGRTRAVLDLRQTEVQVRQDVQAALARIRQARDWLNTYRKSVVPGLEATYKKMHELLVAGEPGVDALKLIDINRKLLRARDVELDARWELLQALADLAAAVGDPALVLDPAAFAQQCAPPPPS
jgi:cobalt-zinc-cadmium efflux system outer membrane protein